MAEIITCGNIKYLHSGGYLFTRHSGSKVHEVGKTFWKCKDCTKRAITTLNQENVLLVIKGIYTSFFLNGFFKDT